MHHASIGHSPRSERSARLLLGADHPLVHDLARIRAADERLVIVAALLRASAAGEFTAVPGALAILIAATVTLGALACQLALLLLRRDECVRRLIIEGRADAPVDVVQRARQRLAAQRTRERYARRLDAIRGAADSPATPTRPRPMWRAAADPAAGRALADIAQRLRDGETSAQGAAMLERLLVDAGSPLPNRSGLASS